MWYLLRQAASELSFDVMEERKSMPLKGILSVRTILEARDFSHVRLHNNSLFYDNNIIKDLENDFLATQEKCYERTTENWKRGAIRILLDEILNVFAPLC